MDSIELTSHYFKPLSCKNFKTLSLVSDEIFMIYLWRILWNTPKKEIGKKKKNGYQKNA